MARSACRPESATPVLFFGCDGKLLPVVVTMAGCRSLSRPAGHPDMRKSHRQKIPTVEKPRRPGDPPRLVASAEKAIRDLGWRPKYPKLEDIVATAWAWHKKHPNGYAD
jgi:hypothetical protein